MHPSDRDGVLQLNAPIQYGKHRLATGLYHIRWYHAPSIHFIKENYRNNHAQNDNSDARILHFTGDGITLCTQIFLSMDFWQLRLGIGAGIKCSFLDNMVGQWSRPILNKNNDPTKPNKKESSNYFPQNSYYFSWTPLLRLGHKIRETYYYSLWLDGTWSPWIFYHSELGIMHYHWRYVSNFDLGSTWERHISRYISWNLRVAYGFCSHNEITQLMSTSADKLSIVTHRISGFLCQVGMRIRIPALSKCPIIGCATRLDHKHCGKAYRGDSFFIPHPNFKNI